jgi:hypothetical protein
MQMLMQMHMMMMMLMLMGRKITAVEMFRLKRA